MNRVIAYTEIPLTPTTWRPLVLTGLLVAQKVWDDRYLSNENFAFIYPFFTNEEINKLEIKFLEMIQYEVTVKSSLYAKYYFELRALFEINEKEFPLTEISNIKMAEIQGRSKHISQLESARASQKSKSELQIEDTKEFSVSLGADYFKKREGGRHILS